MIDRAARKANTPIGTETRDRVKYKCLEMSCFEWKMNGIDEVIHKLRISERGCISDALPKLENGYFLGGVSARALRHGTFGFVDSGRPDVAYIEIDGRKIDRKMLELLRQK